MGDALRNNQTGTLARATDDRQIRPADIGSNGQVGADSSQQRPVRVIHIDKPRDILNHADHYSTFAKAG